MDPEYLQDRLKDLEYRINYERERKNKYKNDLVRYRFIYPIFLASTITVSVCLVMITTAFSKWINAASAERRIAADFAELSLEAEKIKNNLPEVQVQYQYVDIEHSWFYKVFWNWIIPIMLFIIILIFIIYLLFILYEKYGNFIRSPGIRTYSVFSVSASMSGMIFTILRYRADLLEHEVGSYLFLSSFLCFIFFAILILSRNKIIACITYASAIAVVAFVGWFTVGDFSAAVNEYRILLSSLLIPYQVIVLFGTLLPILLVIFAIVFLKKPVKS